MTYEEFVAAWKKLQQVEANDGTPRFTIDELRIAGETREDHAELDVELTIQSLANGPLKVPLGMADAILSDEPRLEVVGATGAAASGGSGADRLSNTSRRRAVSWLGSTGRPSERTKLTLQDRAAVGARRQ